jgi:hypothetical protein
MQLGRRGNCVVLAAIGWLSLESHGRAATIVNWKGDYVSTTQASARSNGTIALADWDGDNSVDDPVTGVPISGTTALNSSIGAAYNGISARFYGGYGGGRLNQSTANGSFDDELAFRITQDGVSDRIGFYLRESTTNARIASGTIFWDKADLLNGANTQTLSLNQSSNSAIGSLAVNIVTSGDGAGAARDPQQLRVFVRNGQTSYVSDVISGFSPTVGLQSVDGVTLQAANFYPLGLVEDSFFENYAYLNTTLGTPVLGSTLGDITGIGITYNTDAGVTGLALNGTLELNSFEVTTVPEPTSIAGIGGMLSLLLVRRCRATVELCACSE